MATEIAVAIQPHGPDDAVEYLCYQRCLLRNGDIRNMSCSVNHHRLVCSKHYGFVGCDGRNDWDNRSFCLV